MSSSAATTVNMLKRALRAEKAGMNQSVLRGAQILENVAVSARGKIGKSAESL